MNSVISWLIAWLLMFLLLFALARTRGGHTIIYYTAWLLVFLLIVMHGDQLSALLKKGNFSS